MSVDAKRKYDSTVARIAGNLLSGINPFPDDPADTEKTARNAVRLARAIIAETLRTEPAP